MSGSSPSGPVGRTQCAGSQPYGLKMPTNRGTFAHAAAFANGVNAGIIESRNGNATATPAPLSIVRREMCFLVMIICVVPNSEFLILNSRGRQRAFGPAIHLKWSAFHDLEHDRRELVVVLLRVPHDRPHG